MSYIDIVNGFWRAHKQQKLSGVAIQIFFYLCNVNNYYRWSEWFYISHDTIANGLSMSTKTVQRGTRELHRNGHINVQKQRGRKPNKYSIKRSWVVSAVHPNVHPSVHPNVHPGVRQIKSNRVIDKEEGVITCRTNETTQRNGTPSPPAKKPRVFMSDLKAQKQILEQRIKALKDAGYEDAWGHNYANKEDKLKAKKLRAQLKALEDRMLETV